MTIIQATTLIIWCALSPNARSCAEFWAVQVAFLVYLNVATMCMYYWVPPSPDDFPVKAPYTPHESYSNVIDKIQWGFLVLFIMEAATRIIGLGWFQYWSSLWNRFDFFVAVLSTIAVCAEFSSETDVIGEVMSPAYLRVVRALRIFPLGKAIRRSQCKRLNCVFHTCLVVIGQCFVI